MPINTTLLSSGIQSTLSQIENLCKTYNPDTDTLATFQANVKAQYASLLANSHSAHVLTASVVGNATAVTVGTGTAPITGTLL